MSIESWLIPVCSVEFNGGRFDPVWQSNWRQFIPRKRVKHLARISKLLAWIGVGAVVHKPHGHQAVLQAGICLLKDSVNVS